MLSLAEFPEDTTEETTEETTEAAEEIQEETEETTEKLPEKVPEKIASRKVIVYKSRVDPTIPIKPVPAWKAQVVTSHS